MVLIKVVLREKWSEVIIPEAKVFVDNILVERTNEEGVLEMDVVPGVRKVCVSKEGYETNCQNFNIVSASVLNVQLKPIVPAL